MSDHGHDFMDEGTILHKIYRRKKQNVYWAKILACAVVLFPLSLHNIDFRSTFAVGLSVSAHKASPAYAAFEDLHENYEIESSGFSEPPTLIESGTKFEFKQNVAVTPLATRQLEFKGLTIRGPIVEDTKDFIFAGQTIESEVVRVSPEVAPGAPAQLYDINGNLLPLRQRKQELIAELKNDTWTTKSVSALAKDLVERELESLPSESQVKFQKGPTIDRGIRPATKVANSDEIPKPEQAIAAAIAAYNPSSVDKSALWLTGQIEMTEGLAFVGPETEIHVKRVLNGKAYESGRIWVTEGRFEIFVKEKTGFLVAELRTSRGRTLGLGEVSLLNVGTASQSEKRINGIVIPLRPTTEGAAFRAISGISYGNNKTPLPGARVEIQSYTDPQRANEDGYVSEPSLTYDSSFVARASAKDHWPTLILGQAREPQDIRLFSEKLVKALINFNLARGESAVAEKLGVVWGRLVRDGSPIAGGQVELAGDYTPIYFDEAYLPDPKLKATGDNGMFAFIKVTPGVQSLRLTLNGKRYAAQVFPSENRHVSYLEMNVSDRVISQLNVYDRYDPNRQLTPRVRIVGDERLLEVSNVKTVAFSIAANPFMLEVDGGVEYQISRVTVAGRPHEINVPVIPREWLYQIASMKNINQSPSRGIIVGQTESIISEVELTGLNRGERLQIFYFDSAGELIEGKPTKPGGGFVIFNAPEGLQTIYLQDAQTKESFSQVVVAERDFVQVVVH